MRGVFRDSGLLIRVRDAGASVVHVVLDLGLEPAPLPAGSEPCSSTAMGSRSSTVRSACGCWRPSTLGRIGFTSGSAPDRTARQLPSRPRAHRGAHRSGRQARRGAEERGRCLRSRRVRSCRSLRVERGRHGRDERAQRCDSSPTGRLQAVEHWLRSRRKSCQAGASGLAYAGTCHSRTVPVGCRPAARTGPGVARHAPPCSSDRARAARLRPGGPTPSSTTRNITRSVTTHLDLDPRRLPRDGRRC